MERGCIRASTWMIVLLLLWVAADNVAFVSADVVQRSNENITGTALSMNVASNDTWWSFVWCNFDGPLSLHYVTAAAPSNASFEFVNCTLRGLTIDGTIDKSNITLESNNVTGNVSIAAVLKNSSLAFRRCSIKGQFVVSGVLNTSSIAVMRSTVTYGTEYTPTPLCNKAHLEVTPSTQSVVEMRANLFLGSTFGIYDSTINSTIVSDVGGVTLVETPANLVCPPFAGCHYECPSGNWGETCDTISSAYFSSRCSVTGSWAICISGSVCRTFRAIDAIPAMYNGVVVNVRGTFDDSSALEFVSSVVTSASRSSTIKRFPIALSIRDILPEQLHLRSASFGGDVLLNVSGAVMNPRISWGVSADTLLARYSHGITSDFGFEIVGGKIGNVQLSFNPAIGTCAMAASTATFLINGTQLGYDTVSFGGSVMRGRVFVKTTHISTTSQPLEFVFGGNFTDSLLSCASRPSTALTAFRFDGLVLRSIVNITEAKGSVLFLAGVNDSTVNVTRCIIDFTPGVAFTGGPIGRCVIGINDNKATASVISFADAPLVSTTLELTSNFACNGTSLFVSFVNSPSLEDTTQRFSNNTLTHSNLGGYCVADICYDELSTFPLQKRVSS